MSFSTSTDYDLWSLLDATGFAISRLRRIELARIGLTIEQSVILDLLSRSEGMSTAKDIENVTMRQHNTVSNLVNRMVKLGLVRKEKSLTRKGNIIVVDETGRALFENMPTGSIEGVFGVFKINERNRFASSLNKLHSMARKLLGGPGFLPFVQRLKTSGEADSSEEAQGHRIPSDYRLWSLLTGTRFSVARLRELELAQFEITIEQASVLRILKEHNGALSSKELGRLTLRQHNSISTLTTRMVQMGLVEKSRCGRDNANRIEITHSGSELLSKVTADALIMTFSVLTNVEKKKLTASLWFLNARARQLLRVSQPAEMTHRS
jgi:DNA-binding MarR family transcriptional regulator